MAKQLNLLETGQIVPTALHTEMQQSYLEYAMSVIVGRALPDVRDGLKPVHRRILYAMHELGLTPDRPFRKCARVVGDVLGKYHPHGDQSVYDALVRMVQSFSSRHPLLAGHGNFGSVDNDPPAAMRYTETRLSAIANESLLSEIGEATVDFIDNFDSSQQEPVVLPAQLPVLLLNGCSGIAVGMATNVPPHNLNEVVDGLVALIDKPDLSDEKLLKIIPGPDFPTGGEIIDCTGVEQAYRTGRGSIPVRGIVTIEEIQHKGRKRDKTALVITELPFQVNKASWIEKIADLVNQGKIEGIADIRDESDRDGMRVVIELKRDGNPHQILNDLYRLTPLKSNFGAIMLALVNNEPRQLSLRQILEEFLLFREQTLTRRYNHELEFAQGRLHILEGLLKALDQLDLVIDILRNAPDGTTAKIRFQEQLGISETQADSILAMPMRRITGLERQKLEKEVEELRTQIQQLELLLRDRNELLKYLKKELRSLKRKFGNERRTRILSESEVQNLPTPKAKSSQTKKTKAKAETEAAPLFQEKPGENAVLEITNTGYIYWTSPENATKTAYSLKRNEDFVTYSQPIQQQKQVAIITNGGKAYPISIEDIPSQTSIPKTLISLLPKSMQDSSDEIISYFLIPEKADTRDLILLTQQGKIKRLALSELEGLGNRGLMLVKLKEKDYLSHICWTQEDEDVIVATTGGRLLRLPIRNEQIPLMGRNAQGNQVSRLRAKEGFAGCVSVNSKNPDPVLLISEAGYMKRLEVDNLRFSARGDLGTQALQFTNKTDHLVAMVKAIPNSQVMLQTNQERGLCLDVDKVKIWSKDGVGDSYRKLKSEETIIQVTPLDY